MVCLSENRTTAPPTTTQNLTLQAAERLIRRRATPSDADDLIDLFRAETASGVTPSDALAGIQAWIGAEANPSQKSPAIAQVPRGHTPGFAIVPAELLHNKDWMETVPHDLRVFLHLLRFAGGKGTAFPSSRTLANSAFIPDITSVNRSLRALERKGWIKTTEPLPGRRTKTRQIVLPGLDKLCPVDRQQVSNSLYKEEERSEKTTTTAAPQLASNPVATNKGGGGFPAKTSKQQTPTTKPTSTIINGQTLPGVSSMERSLVQNLLHRANLPAEVETGILQATKEAAEAGAIRTSADRYAGGLVSKFRNGLYTPAAVLQQEANNEKAVAMAEIRRKELEAQQAEKEQEQAQKEQLEATKAELTSDELAKLKADFIELLRSQKSLSFQRYKAVEFKGFSFDLGFDGWLRKKLLA